MTAAFASFLLRWTSESLEEGALMFGSDALGEEHVLSAKSTKRAQRSV